MSPSSTIKPPTNDTDDTPGGARRQTAGERPRTRWLAGGLIGVVVGAVVLAVGAAASVALREPPPDPALSTVDVGFLQDMIDHHRQGVEIADAYLTANPDGAAAPFAQEVERFQRRDIGRMNDWLRAGGATPGAADRQAMTWMGMGTTVATMPGMQLPARLEQLANASGERADRLFFDIMSDHHRGAIHMAEYASSNGANDVVREFAAKVATGQRAEIVEYAQAIERLGL